MLLGGFIRATTFPMTFPAPGIDVISTHTSTIFVIQDKVLRYGRAIIYTFHHRVATSNSVLLVGFIRVTTFPTTFPGPGKIGSVPTLLQFLRIQDKVLRCGRVSKHCGAIFGITRVGEGNVISPIILGTMGLVDGLDFSNFAVDGLSRLSVSFRLFERPDIDILAFVFFWLPEHHDLYWHLRLAFHVMDTQGYVIQNLPFHKLNVRISHRLQLVITMSWTTSRSGFILK